jgi:hypothetical protein
VLDCRVETFDQRKYFGEHHFVERVSSEVVGLSRRQPIFVAQQGALEVLQLLAPFRLAGWRPGKKRSSLNGEYVMQIHPPFLSNGAEQRLAFYDRPN